MFIFAHSLEQGKAGETAFLNKFKDKLVRLDGFKADFMFGDKKVELKTDYYDSTKTQNFFIERWSDKKNKKAGGPWQAANNKSDYYCYFFIKNDLLYSFDTKKLVDALEELILFGNYEETEILNTEWITTGYKIPRKLLENAMIPNLFQ